MVPPVTAHVITAIQTFLVCSYDIFTFAGMLLMGTGTGGKPRRPVLNSLWYVTRWPALAYVCLYLLLHLLRDGTLHPWQWFSNAFSFLGWWVFRDVGDDDDYKKLKKKLKDKIAVRKGKLVTVPEPS